MESDKIAHDHPQSESRGGLSRRQFLTTAGLMGVVLAVASSTAAQGGNPSSSPVPGDPPTTTPASSPSGTQESAPSQASRKTTGALGSSGKGPSAANAVVNGPAAGEGDIPQRPLGKTGLTVSALGLGGHHLGDADSVNEAMNIVHEAVDVGVMFFDNCWE